jgi:hypothetical protein
MSKLITAQLNKREERILDNTLKAWPKKARSVEVRSVNKVATKERTRILKAIRSTINIKATTLRKSNVQLNKARFNSPTAQIFIRGGRIALIESTGTRDLNPRGVSYKILKSGPRKRIPDGFIRTMSSGHEGVFKRKFTSRLPIMELHGPSIPEVIDDVPEFKPETQAARLADNLAKEVKTQADLVISKAR